MAEKCPKCNGSGKIVEDGEPKDCPECDGTGEVAAKEPEKD
jgi:DnaJ-class molecular chaperone